MKDIELSVKKAAVFNTVAMMASYEGAKNQTTENDSYNRLSISRQEEEELVPFWNEACGSILSACSDYIKSSSFTGDLDIVLSIPDNFKEEVKGSIEENMASFLSRFIAGRWISLSDQEKGGTYTGSASGYLDDVRSLMYERQFSKRPEPKRPEVRVPKHIIHSFDEVTII